MPENFYDLLGVDEDATKEELKSAYRQRAREFHPDVNADDRAGAQFKTVRRAYDVLCDETERSAYDRLGHESYVRKRMKGLPTESSSSSGTSSTQSAQTSTTQSSSSTRSSSQSTSHSRSSSTSRSSARSSSSSTTGGNTRWNGSTGSRRRRQTSQRTQQTTGPTSRRSYSQAADATSKTSRQYTPRDGEPTTSGRERLRNRWVVVAVAFALYLGGLAQFGLANRPVLTDLVAALSADPVGTLTATGGFGAPVTFVRTAVMTATSAPSAALLLPLGMVVLPLALVWTVSSFGRGSAWLYVVATFGPLVGVAVELTLPTVPTGIELLAFAALPVAAPLVFLGDVGRYLVATR